jgi:hypothetical protein
VSCEPPGVCSPGPVERPVVFVTVDGPAPRAGTAFVVGGVDLELWHAPIVNTAIAVVIGPIRVKRRCVMGITGFWWKRLRRRSGWQT